MYIPAHNEASRLLGPQVPQLGPTEASASKQRMPRRSLATEPAPPETARGARVFSVIHFPSELGDVQSVATLYASFPEITEPSGKAGRYEETQASELPHPTVQAVCGPEHPVRVVDPLPTGLQESPSKHV